MKLVTSWLHWSSRVSYEYSSHISQQRTMSCATVSVLFLDCSLCSAVIDRVAGQIKDDTVHLYLQPPCTCQQAHESPSLTRDSRLVCNVFAVFLIVLMLQLANRLYDLLLCHCTVLWLVSIILDIVAFPLLKSSINNDGFTPFCSLSSISGMC